MTPEAPRPQPEFGIEPVNVMVTVNETFIKIGLAPQLHQLYRLGQSIMTEAAARGFDPQWLTLPSGEILDIWEVEGGDMGIQVVKDRERTDFLGIAVDDNGQHGEQKYSAIGGDDPRDRNRIGQLMIAACEQIMGIDLTPQPPTI